MRRAHDGLEPHQHPRKRRKKDNALVSHGGFGEPPSPSVSVALNTQRVCLWSVGMHNEVSTIQYTVRIPVVGTQNLIYRPSWYSTLFESYNTNKDALWLPNDPNVPTVYDPVLDEQVAAVARNRVCIMFFHLMNSVLALTKSAQLNPLKEWLEYIPGFLDELLWLEGRGEFANQSFCGQCNREFNLEVASYRCQNCSYGRLSCKKCVVKFHAQNPLHRIEVSVRH